MEVREEINKLRDKKNVDSLVLQLHKLANVPVRIMESCGMQTTASYRHGLRPLLPETIQFVSGPSCPMCVTSGAYIDAFVSLSYNSGVRVMTYGDLYRVPGTYGSLAQAASLGAKVEIVYSPMDALERAKENPDELIVFLGAGFATTIPAVSATIQAAKDQKIENFTVFSAHKRLIPALSHLFEKDSLQIDGLLCPGHVSVILGAGEYQGLVDKYHLSCVVSGYEPVDILHSLICIVRQHAVGIARVDNCYKRVVTWEGNTVAQRMINEVFIPTDTIWRGLGMVPQSGFTIRPEYAKYDAVERLGIVVPEVDEHSVCLCGEILKGKNVPADCLLFGEACTPAGPVGPCMVSSEGSCAAYFRYGCQER
jgi:hydrogenase expression/formation protein HypD